VYLYVVGGFALMTVFSHQMLLMISREDEANDFVVAFFRCLQAIELVVFLFAVTVAILRSKNSELARPATAAVSILLAIWPPFGTAAFVWWVGWVRRRESKPGHWCQCGYDLRGLPAPRCPECGETV
jgi:peptidoglycan biosynthesis protein MviN/MurJ (putative lipid II flippase)